jgi:RND family efflux transporter MFP subunit
MDSMKTFRLSALMLLLAGCSGGASDNAETAPDAIALVKTAPVTSGAARDDLTVYGAAEAGPGAERTIAAPSEAIIAAIDAPNGTVVRAGQPIVTLRPSATSQVDALKAHGDAATASAAYDRALRLRTDGLVSDADVETARGAMIAARAAAAAPRVGVHGLVLRAPAAGIVQGVTAKPGDQIASGATVASIVTRRDLRARFGVDPAILPRFRLGQSITISRIAGGAPIASKIDGVDPQVDAGTRLASIYAPVPIGTGVGLGESVRGGVAVSGSAKGLTIPYAALLDDGGRSYVFVVKDGIARSRDVSPGNSAGDRIQILKGVVAGEQVVTEGGTALEDGMKVRQGDDAPAGEGGK